MVETLGKTEHALKVNNVPNVPTANKSTIEYHLVVILTAEHVPHTCHLRCVPAPDVLIESRSLVKHFFHAPHLRCIPGDPNVLIERGRRFKHSAHVHNIARIPAGNIGVEIGIARKGFRHVCDETGVPLRHRAKLTRITHPFSYDFFRILPQARFDSVSKSSIRNRFWRRKWWRKWRRWKCRRGRQPFARWRCRPALTSGGTRLRVVLDCTQVFDVESSRTKKHIFLRR